MKQFTRQAWLLVIAALVLSGCATAPATSEEKENLVGTASAAMKQMQTADSTLGHFLDDAYGYAIFPNVGKGGLIAGGAYGRGIVYEQAKHIGYSDLTQATLGLQAGGQSYMELVVFENRSDLTRFTSGKLSFSANVSAVALKSGAAEAAKYTDGVAVFVKPIGGLMLEASLGGQQFTFEAK